MNKTLFLLSAACLWVSCSIVESPVLKDEPHANDSEITRIAYEALGLRQTFYGSAAVKSSSANSLSVVRVSTPVKSSTAYIPYVVNYPDGGYAILADNGTDVIPVVLGDAGSFNPQILSDAFNFTVPPTVSDTALMVRVDEEDVLDPEDAPHGDEHIPYYPMDLLPYDYETSSNTLVESGIPVHPDNDKSNPFLGNIVDFFLTPGNTPPRTDNPVTTVPGIIPQPPTPCPDSLKGKWLQVWGVKPLLQTEWHQKYPYNQFCPIIDGVHAVAGCVPIAVAQIGAYLAPPGKSWDWGTMIGHGADAEILAAEFIAYAGDKVKADYGTSATSANDKNARRFLRNQIGCRGVSIRECTDFSKFYNRVTDRLKHRLPVYMSGANSDNEGHAYVIDGFVEQKMYTEDSDEQRRALLHVNWGWANYNGCFLADLLDYTEQVVDLTGNAPMQLYGTNATTYDGRAKTITYKVPTWM